MLSSYLMAIALGGVLVAAAQQAESRTLKCDGDEAPALRTAPFGAHRVSKDRLTVRWAAGTRTFRDAGVVDGFLDGISYQYCGYSPALGFHLIHKHDNDFFTGVLLNHATGALQPAGQEVIFAPDTSRYFASVQPDGLDGEEWNVYSRAGVRLWKGLSGISAKHPSLKYDYFIATLEAPYWSSDGELQATLKCSQGNGQATVVTLTRRAGGYSWLPRVACSPAT